MTQLPDDRPLCAHCGEPVSGRGPSSALVGARYHSNRRTCRAAAERARRSAHKDAEPAEMERRRCACCNAYLPHRERRKTDLEIGRWCQKRKCQQHKLFVLDQESERRGVDDEEDARLAAGIPFVLKEDCPECGRKGVLPQTSHPLPDWSAPCHGVGEADPFIRMGARGPLARAAIKALYPKESA